MTMIASIHGRVGQDPVERTTKSGAAMTTVSVAVDVAGKDAEPTTLWVSVLAFGAASEALLRAQKGEMLSAMGRLTRGSYTSRTGEEREQWTMLADSVMTVASARPTGGKRKGQGQYPGLDRQRHEASMRAQDSRPFDDELSF